MERYPLRFRPILKERVWGGRGLATLFDREIPLGIRIGEAWEIVDRPPDTSVVENGPLAGHTLRDLCEQFGRHLLGRDAPWTDRFPLMVKILDPNDRLSIQVHPTAAYVRHHPEAEGTKNEMWYALRAEPGAQIILGLEEGVTLEQFRTALEGGEIEPLLRFVPVQAGRFYCVPSGLLHALLPGSVMVEIQQNCDTTFRLHDWGRLGLDGKPRELHVTEALETAETFLADPALARHEVLGPQALGGGVERVGGLACPSFRVEELRLPPGAGRLAHDAASFTIVTALEGALALSCAGGRGLEAELRRGGSSLVPAGGRAARFVSGEGGALVLVTRLPLSSAARG